MTTMPMTTHDGQFMIIQALWHDCQMSQKSCHNLANIYFNCEDFTQTVSFVLTGGCYLGSVTMWKFEFVGKRNISTHGYSFWCAVSATICMILGTLLMIIGLVRTRNYVPVSQS